MEKPSYASSEVVLANSCIAFLLHVVQLGLGREMQAFGPCYGTNLVGSDFERVPFYPWEDVAEESGVVLHVRLLELRIAEMEREGGGGGFAGFDGAGEEVDC